MSDGTDSIKISLKNDFGLQVKLNETYAFINMKIPKYMTTRLLKTQETTTIKRLDDFTLLEETIPSTQKSKRGTIISVCLESLRITFICTKCRESLPEPSEEIIICHKCNSMMLASECGKDSDVEFTLKSSIVNETLKCKRSILENMFVINDADYADLDQTRKNITIAKVMIKKNVEVKYDSSCDEVSVINLIRSH